MEPERSRDLVEHLRDAIEPIERIDDDRHNAEQEADCDLRQIAEAEEHDQQRIEREHRNRVIRSKQRLEHTTYRGKRVNNDRHSDPHDHRAGDRCRDVSQRDLQIRRIAARREDVQRRDHDRRGWREGESRDDAGAAKQFQEREGRREN